MLKLADLAVRGTDEKPPKVTIHLPPTPATEVPPPSPAPSGIKLIPKAVKPQIKISARRPSMPSPVATLTPGPTKLRLQPSTPKPAAVAEEIAQPEFKVPLVPLPKAKDVKP